jgi:hypothetical protein
MPNLIAETHQATSPMDSHACTQTPNWKEWSVPVQLELDGLGRYRSIRSVKQALQLLVDDWPETSSPLYRNAVYMCDAALKGETCPDDARRSFIDAARCAEVTVNHR